VLTPRPTADDLDYRDLYEIIDGQRVEIAPMSADSQVFASRLVRHLSNYGIERDIGEAYTEVMFKLPLPKDRNRRPDAAFVPYSRWPRNVSPPSVNAWDVLPEVCVEVVSPHDLADEVAEKMTEYFAAGVRQVWVVYPRHGLFYVYDSLTQVRGLTRADELDGGAVLPGFKLRLADLFPEAGSPAAG
jgi:Uma2 family endonuclease